MPGKLNGPAVTVRMSCYGCLHETSERYACQGDSGFDVYCNHASFPERRHISISASTTPKWCPCLPLDELTTLRARVAELEGENAELECHLRESNYWRMDALDVAEMTEDAESAALEEVARLRGLLKEVE